MAAVETASVQASRHQDEFRFVGDSLLLYTRRLGIPDDLPDDGVELACSVERHLANGRRSHNATERIIFCETRRPCDDHFEVR